MREKLMRIVCDALEDGCVGHCNYPHCYRVNSVVDHLIANGVTIPVRCKECVWCEKGKDYEPYCSHPTDGMYNVQMDDFCSYGERRTDD